ncbi:HET-domain-containing protein [Aulographum hederae CBS 113979]|uniref:HET-domain-containing protein n=1 Tax=Aulographum hederae CBS 113979 TaxID=1176131 RepID=A0A6G1HBC9_9PEZI|nr:HET-domain-containing protein [Aulographum hederae CBS 113979]
MIPSFKALQRLSHSKSGAGPLPAALPDVRCAECIQLDAHDFLGVLHLSITDLEECPCAVCLYIFRLFTDDEIKRAKSEALPSQYGRVSVFPLQDLSGKEKVRKASDRTIRNAVLEVNVTWHTGILVRRGVFLCTDSSHAFDRSFWQSAPQLGFDNRVSTIRSWITECTESHPKCKGNNLSFRPLAARYIDVGVGVGGQTNNIRLVSTRSILEKCQGFGYLALSYCWGGVDIPVKTTTKRYAKYHECILFDDLPKTFQDVVTVTRAVGVRYLWIDSLCIVQDDTRDWQREAAKMASIFGAALLTISATASQNCNSGCGISTIFEGASAFPRAPKKSTSAPIAPGSIRGLSLRYPHVEADKKLFHFSPLHDRGWIFQESLLSRRMLHLTPNQFWWQCRTLIDSEDGFVYSREPQTRIGIAGSILPLADFSSVVKDKTNDPFRSANGLWWDVVRDFTQRRFTQPSDNYAGLAGVMKMFQSLSGDRDFCGLWWKDIGLHLSWWIDTGRSTKPHITTLPGRIPSWTWMSLPHDGSLRVRNWVYPHRMDDQIWNEKWSFKTQVKSEDMMIRWTGAAWTSIPSSGALTVRGLLGRMQGFKREAEPPPNCSTPRWAIKFDPDVRNEIRLWDSFDVLNIWTAENNGDWVDRGKYRSAFLILLPAEGAKAYRRLGLLVIEMKSKSWMDVKIAGGKFLSDVREDTIVLV